MTKKKRPSNTQSLNPRNNRRSRDYVDYDYLDKLSDEELLWLATFSNEYYSNNFKKDGYLTHRDDRKPYYSRNNARNRDILNNPEFKPSPEFIAEKTILSPEEAIIEALDDASTPHLHLLKPSDI